MNTNWIRDLGSHLTGTVLQGCSSCQLISSYFSRKAWYAVVPLSCLQSCRNVSRTLTYLKWLQTSLFIWLNWVQKSCLSQFKPMIFCSLHNIYFFEDHCASPPSSEKTLLSDLPHSSCFWAHWPFLCYLPFLQPVHIFFLLSNMLFQTGHDVPPFASSYYRGGITHFCLMTLPLYIYLRIKFTFCITLFDLALWSLLTWRSSCDCSYRTQGFFIVFELFFCL